MRGGAGDGERMPCSTRGRPSSVPKGSAYPAFGIPGSKTRGTRGFPGEYTGYKPFMTVQDMPSALS